MARDSIIPKPLTTIAFKVGRSDFCSFISDNGRLIDGNCVKVVGMPNAYIGINLIWDIS